MFRASILYTYSGQVEEVRLRDEERKLSNFFSPIPRHVSSVHKLHLEIYVGNSTVTSFPQIFPTKFSRAFHYTYRASQTTRHSVKHCMICRRIYLQYIWRGPTGTHRRKRQSNSEMILKVIWWDGLTGTGPEWCGSGQRQIAGFLNKVMNLRVP
jgi:hypothetical protein